MSDILAFCGCAILLFHLAFGQTLLRYICPVSLQFRLSVTFMQPTGLPLIRGHNYPHLSVVGLISMLLDCTRVNFHL